MLEKDYKSILAKYEFKNKFGHSLEMVTDYQDLLAELERLREAERERGQILYHENKDASSNLDTTHQPPQLVSLRRSDYNVRPKSATKNVPTTEL